MYSFVSLFILELSSPTFFEIVAAAQTTFVRWLVTIHNYTPLVKLGFEMIDTQFVHVGSRCTLRTLRFSRKASHCQRSAVMFPTE